MVRHRGFTLAEVLVTVALIAVLAAVMVPALGTQMQKRDTQRIGDDMVAIRSGVEAFLADVRKYPGGVSQLIYPIVAGTDQPLDGSSYELNSSSQSPYGDLETARWRGPYLNKDTTTGLGTGFGFRFKSKFDTVTLADTGTRSTAGGQKYMVLSLPMVVSGSGHTSNDQASALVLDLQFDDGSLNTGQIRYRICASTGCSGSADTLKYLVMPIS